jgi:hypothetical protein
MPSWLPDPLWPWLLGLALVYAVGGWICRDRRAEWVCGATALGIIAVQFTGPEPGRWVIAAGIWIFFSAVVWRRVGAQLAAAILWFAPVGFALLALDGFGLLPLGTEGRWTAHGIAEVAEIAATVIGGRGVPHGLQRMGRRWLAGRRRNRVAGVALDRAKDRAPGR